MEPMFLRNLFCYFCLCQKKARVPNKPYRQTINDFELFRRSTDKILCSQFVHIMTLIFFSLNKCVYNPKRTKKWAQVKCTHIKMACSFCRIFAYGLIFWLWTLLSRSDFKLMKVQEKQDNFFLFRWSFLAETGLSRRMIERLQESERKELNPWLVWCKIKRQQNNKRNKTES